MTIAKDIDSSFDIYQKGVEKTNDELYSGIIAMLSKYSVNGNLSGTIEQTATIKSSLISILQKSSYTKSVTEYLKLFDKIDKIRSDYYKSNKLPIDTILKDNDLIKYQKESAIKALRGVELVQVVLEPIEKIITNKVLTNSVFSDTIDVINRVVVQEPLLTKYTTAVAKSVMYSYDGAINNEVKVKYDLKYFFYVGAEIEATRPMCDHIKDKFGSKAISTDELKIILDEFCPNGKPSDVMITYTTVNGVKMTKKKGSGLFNDTDIDNFAINRGGHNCIHEVLYTRRPK